MQKKNTIISFLIFLFLAIPTFSQGLLKYATTTQVAWPTSPGGTSIGPNTPFHEFIRYIYDWGISLGGIVVFVMLVWSGIEYLTSAGDVGKMGAAMKRIRSSILGLILLLTSWLILNTINPQFVQLRALPPIRDERGFLGLGMDLMLGSAPPCDFVAIYPVPGWPGDPPGPPIRFQKPALPDRNYFEVIRIERGARIHDPTIGEPPPEIPTHPFTLDQHARPWASARGFIRLTEEEITNIEKGFLNIDRYDGEGKRIPEGERLSREELRIQYKEGGLCNIAIFHTTTRWFHSDPCGGRLAVSNLPVRDFNEIKFRTESITCAEVSRVIPKNHELLSPHQY